MEMLDTLEIYASECYDKTQEHISNVKNTDTLDNLKKYDYKTGYPDVLKFKLKYD